MTFRSELRTAIADAGALCYADLEKKFPGKNIGTPLSQMTAAKQLKRDGKGGDAIYTIGTRGKRDAPRPGKKQKKIARSGIKAHAKKSRPRQEHATSAIRGDPIEATIAELQRRRDGIDQAIAVLEALA